MIKTLLICLTGFGLLGMVGCCSDRDRTTTTSSYQSASYDSKDMHPRHTQNGQ